MSQSTFRQGSRSFSVATIDSVEGAQTKSVDLLLPAAFADAFKWIDSCECWPWKVRLYPLMHSLFSLQHKAIPLAGIGSGPPLLNIHWLRACWAGSVIGYLPTKGMDSQKERVSERQREREKINMFGAYKMTVQLSDRERER